jgi:hypothetical protein
MINKRIIVVLVALLIIIISIFGCSHFSKSIDNSNENIKNEQSINSETYDIEKAVEFLGSVSGVKAVDVEIINNPIGFKGELFVPKESIANGVDYYLSHTNNEKMKDLKISIDEKFISIYVNYKVNNIIKTPIEVIIKPILNENKDLVINIDEVKFLDIKVADWIVNLTLNSFIKDWFPSNGDLRIEFNKGNVVIYKENFQGISLNNISIEDQGLNINMSIDLKKIIMKSS